MGKEHYLVPDLEVLKIDGKLVYHEGSRAWSKILMKKELIGVFKQLRDKQNFFGYTMEYPLSEEAKREFIEFLKNSDEWPIFLRFRKIEKG